MHVKNIFDKLFRKVRVKNNKNFQISNKDISIISSNCNGGVLAHDLNIRFNSPFVNLYIEPNDYIKMLKNLENYMNTELKFVHCKDFNFPVGILNDIKIFFQHYSSEEEALISWNRRKSRINYDNLLILFCDRDGCSEENLKEFDDLPYSRKVCFVHLPHSDIKSAFYIPGFENDTSVGVLTYYRKDKIGVRYFDVFNFRKLIDG